MIFPGVRYPALCCFGREKDSALLFWWRERQRLAVLAERKTALCCFGGGKDSTVLLRWRERQYCTVLVERKTALSCFGGEKDRKETNPNDHSGKIMK